jgi:P-type conjugative transfer protein TrbJ
MPISCNRLSRRRLLAGGAAAVLLAPSYASAQLAVVCPTCDQFFTQLFQYAKEAAGYATQLQQYATQLQQYQTMVTNTVALPMQAWGTVQGDIMQVRNISNMASVLTGNSGSILQRLQSASGYSSQLGNIANMPNQFATWQQTIGNNLNTLGRTLGLQQGQEASDAQLLAVLRAHSQSAAGQMQAIQAGNELAGANAAQLMQIQATLAATAQMQAGQYAVDADRRALGDAALAQFNAPPRVPVTGYQSW